MTFLLLALCLGPSLAVFAIAAFRTERRVVSLFEVVVRYRREVLAERCERRRAEAMLSVLLNGKFPE